MSASPSLRAFLDLPERQRWLGPFQLLKQIGRGGFAPVWLAREVHAGTDLRTVALKLFSLDSAGTPEASRLFRARVVEEARALCQVEHPCIVRFYALQSDETRKILGLAMEYLPGPALDRRLGEEGKLPIPEVLRIGMMVASALAAAHRARLVHCDVKPSNVVEASGAYKLIDFGIAAAEVERSRTIKMVDGLLVFRDSVVPGEAATLDGRNEAATGLDPAVIAGTIGYLDPECAVGGCRPTPASDIYSLGVLLFQCLTGKLPARVSAATGKGLDEEVLSGQKPNPSLREVAPDVPHALGRLVDQMLAARAGDRPRSAEWVVAELDRIRGSRHRPLPDEKIGPFRGLRRFEGADRDVYFGRVGEIATAIDMLRTRGLVALVGPSGSGKSSLARAGVLPRVAEGALGGWPEQWDVVIAPADDDPRRLLAARLEALDPELKGALDHRGSDAVDALARRAYSAGRGLLLFFDQLEELAESGPASVREWREWLVELLASLGERAEPGVRALVTVRRDLLDPILAADGLGKAILRGSLLVAPIEEAAWGNVIDQALEVYGYSMEEGLREELAAQLRGASSAMPLVQFALAELWRKRDPVHKRLTREGLNSIGGIAGALDRHANAALSSIEGKHAHGRRIAKDVLLALTSPNGMRLRREVREIEQAAGDGAAGVLKMLEKERLIVRDASGVTLAHEALLTQWKELRTWIHEVRLDREHAAELEAEAARWEEDDSLPVLRARRLYQANELIRRGMVPISPAAARFVQAGRRAARQRRLLPILTAFSGLMLVASSAALYVRNIDEARALAERKEKEATQKEREATQKGKQLEQAVAQLAEAQKRVERLAADLKERPDAGRLNQLEDALRKTREINRQLKQRLEQPPEKPLQQDPPDAPATATYAPPSWPEPESTFR